MKGRWKRRWCNTPGGKEMDVWISPEPKCLCVCVFEERTSQDIGRRIKEIIKFTDPAYAFYELMELV